MTTLADLTTASVNGSGVFDTLMRAAKTHLEQEHTKGRIKGPEYATVYLGSMDSVLQAAVQFLLAKDKSTAEIALLEQQRLNAVAENAVLVSQKAKLDAEKALTDETLAKTTAEIDLLTWKSTTEKAQTLGAGVDADSVIGKQKTLYQAQADGFKRDAEQKATKILVDTWNVRRTTDEATIAGQALDPVTGLPVGTDNGLGDANIARAITKLLTGVGA